MGKISADKEAFGEFLKYYGRFYKMRTSDVVSVFAQNSGAEMLADKETWARFGRRVSYEQDGNLAVVDGEVKYYFDISQTTGETIPHQWALNKPIAVGLTASINAEHNHKLANVSRCIDFLTSASITPKISEYAKSFGIQTWEAQKFYNSLLSITRHIVGGRCSHGSKYNQLN